MVKLQIVRIDELKPFINILCLRYIYKIRNDI